MAGTIIEFFRSKLAALQSPPPLLPIERAMAKRWVKERLKRMYPDLRNDPRALEAAYRALSLEPRAGQGEGGETLFDLTLPGRVD